MYDLMVFGDYFFDIIYTGLPEFPALGREVHSTGMTTTGGAMYITATALRRLGVNVCWPAQFGTDPYSQHVRDLAEHEGVDLTFSRTFDHPFRHVTSSLPLHGERAFATYVDPVPEDHYPFWARVARDAQYRHLHIGGIHAIEDLEPIFEAARAQGATISIDSSDTPHLTSGYDWTYLLSQVDIFMPNAREAQLISGYDSVPDTLAHLRKLVDVVVIKDGDCGAWAANRDEVIHVPCVQAGEVIDTTGAGDCFNAGFLYGYVVERTVLENCLRYGNICGGLSVTGVGGATTAPTLEQLREWLQRTPHAEHIAV